jgi:hypothetical protein
LKLQDLLDRCCKIVKIYPMVFGSDAEINTVTVEVSCPDKNIHKIRSSREQAIELREFIRIKILIPNKMHIDKYLDLRDFHHYVLYILKINY